MYQLLMAVFGFIVAILILVTVHEFGHFYVARRFGIKVNRFSIGFGHPFFRWYDKLGTEYVLSAIPLGGYVSLYGERSHNVPESEQHMSYSHKPVWVRMLVLAAGPFFNFFLAIFAYWLMFLIGISSVAPIIGQIQPGSIAELSGLRYGQEIVSIDNKPVMSWEGITVAMIDKMGEEPTLSLAVRDKKNGPLTTHILHLGDEHLSDPELVLKELGISALDPTPAVVGELMSGYPAQASGLRVNDIIVGVNNKPLLSRSEISEYIQARNGELLTLDVVRGQEKKKIQVMPIAERQEDGKVIGFIGLKYATNVMPVKDMMRVQRFGPIDAFKQATSRTYEYIILTLKMLKKMVFGAVSLKHISGPISIAQYAGQSVSVGLEYFLSFLAVISISLGVLNLLPIPLLDGGHLFFCLAEIVIGRKVPDWVENIGVWLGASLLLAITILAFYNDLSRF